MKVLILGAGLVGGPMALDLARDANLEVTVADINTARLEKFAGTPNIRVVKQDLSNEMKVKVLAAAHDRVINAVPGFMGFSTLKAVIESERDVVDIAFAPEDPMVLDALAREKGVTAIVDCGVAPGMTNMLTGYAYNQLNQTDSAVIYVGGLPSIREWPWEYKAVFSPIDVLEEYLREASVVENGRIVTKAALSEPEYVHLAPIGTLEAFITDGLRTLVHTLDIPNMKEKTMRYPGHIEKIAMLKASGFFSQETIMVGDTPIRPIDVTAHLLFPRWELKQGDRDITLMRVVVKGRRGQQKVRLTYDLYDTYDPQSGVHSMARTTGYTATAVLRMLAQGLYAQPGIIAPERIGMQPACMDFLFEQLRQRGIVYQQQEEVGESISM